VSAQPSDTAPQRQELSSRLCLIFIVADILMVWIYAPFGRA
jgi:hypothetical protein